MVDNSTNFNKVNSHNTLNTHNKNINSLNTKNTTYDIGNLVSGLVQAQQNRLMESQTPS